MTSFLPLAICAHAQNHMMADLQELLGFLSLDFPRLDLKSTALDYVVGLTGSKDGQRLIRDSQGALKCLLDLTKDTHPPICRDAHLALVNLSAAEDIAHAVVGLDVMAGFLQCLADPTYTHADQICMILSNLTRSEHGAIEFVKAVGSSGASKCPTLHQLVDIFDRPGFNKEADFHYLATIFSNISQVPAAREMLLDRSKCIVAHILPYTQFDGSLVRRSGVVRLLRNLCFEVGSHEWLLGDDVDILPSLLLPLAGPEQFEGEEEKVEKLPDDLQYLPDDKQREPDPEIRKMLIEAVMKLCTTKFGREYLRAKQTYLIMRELHKWETDLEVSAVCESAISILIADEPEEGMANLEEVALPEDGSRTS